MFDSNKAFNEFTTFSWTLGKAHCRGSLPSMIRLKALEVKVGRKTKLPVALYDHHGDEVPVPSGSFSVQVTDPTGSELHTQLCSMGNDCTVTFTPKVSGLHQVCGFFLRQKLINEQTLISVTTNNPGLVKFGNSINDKDTFKSLSGFAIDDNNIIYMADVGNGLIKKLSANGEFLSQFSMVNHYQDSGILLDVTALDVKNGLLYCTYEMDRRRTISRGKMLIFNLDGVLQYTVKSLI